ncbi:hypothetical protein N5D52_14840 [Pseudomonas sp. GD03860]|uniref:hypothetical protein n=1 Tax=Pseudomonas sp. GD03860 TaxID=2975389 RepID=UPI00244D2015|nr:hypothetical protein [Pseudomonas sp. GD03860]MDH0638222.1 hypothetical protein [Pseudomonas sp. GD03860]
MPFNANGSASALFVAALALISDYSSLCEQISKPAATQVAGDVAEVSRLRTVISGLITDWVELDGYYAKSVAKVATMTSLDHKHFLRNMELLKATRQLEESLLETAVPAPLAEEHNRFRRSVARVRTRLATMDMMYRQFFVRPNEFPTSLRSADLIDLANHTTKRIAQIA